MTRRTAQQQGRKRGKTAHADKPLPAQQSQQADGMPGKTSQHETQPAKKSQRSGREAAARDDVEVTTKSKRSGREDAACDSMEVPAKSQRNAGSSKAASGAPLRKRERHANSREADDAAEGSGDEFKENAGRQMPAITTRHLKVGERSFVCKVINTEAGVKRMWEEMKERKLFAWRLAFKHRAADDSSDDEEQDGDAPNADPAVLANCTDVGDSDEHVVGMAVACSGDHCWFLSAAAFRTPEDFWAVCAQVLTSGEALKATYSCQRVLLTLLRHGIDLGLSSGYGAGGGVGHTVASKWSTCRLWDVAVAVWAVEDAGARGCAKSSARATAGGKAKTGKKGKGKGANKNKAMTAADSSKSLHQACVLHAPTVAGSECACLCLLL